MTNKITITTLDLIILAILISVVGLLVINFSIHTKEPADKNTITVYVPLECFQDDVCCTVFEDSSVAVEECNTPDITTE